jgi:large subunit ribosomal protein L25
MSVATLSAALRVETGKNSNRRTRRGGRIPGVIYGEKSPVNITVDSHDYYLLTKSEHNLISLNIENKSEEVIIREVQYHPVHGFPLHIDFMRVQKGHALTMSVPVHFEGRAKGVIEGGLFSSHLDELNISVLPKDIPEHITIDIAGLGIGDQIRVSDLKFETFKILNDSHEVVCQVQRPKVETVVEPGEERVEPEVITERKPKEE